MIRYIWNFMLFSSLEQHYNLQDRAGIIFSLSDQGDHFGHQQCLNWILLSHIRVSGSLVYMCREGTEVLFQKSS